MKKKVIAMALAAGITVASLATMASAERGWGGRGYGYPDCPRAQAMQQGAPQLDDATKAKIAQFFKDTEPMHKQMFMKRAEERALMQQASPDPKAVAQLAGEIYDLRAAMKAKAEEAGVADYVGPRMGPGQMMGRMGGMGGMNGMGRGQMGRMGHHMGKGMGGWGASGYGQGFGPGNGYGQGCAPCFAQGYGPAMAGAYATGAPELPPAEEPAPAE